MLADLSIFQISWFMHLWYSDNGRRSITLFPRESIDRLWHLLSPYVPERIVALPVAET